MATVFLTETNWPPRRDPRAWKSYPTIMQECVRADRVREHRVVRDPADADVILCVQSTVARRLAVLRHPLRRAYPERFFWYSQGDYVFPFAPGLFPSLSRGNCEIGRSEGGPYLETVRSPLEATPLTGSERYLFSFVGAADTWPLRRKLLQLNGPRTPVRDTSAEPARNDGTLASEAYEAYAARYAAVMRASTFVLCPRGAGPGSVRLFETMKAGRVPVILADEWVEPIGPDWPSFSIRVREAQWRKIPSLLEALLPGAREMGRLAAEAWREWYAADVIFHRLVESCLRMRASRRVPERVSSWLVRPRLFARRNLRLGLLAPIKEELRASDHDSAGCVS